VIPIPTGPYAAAILDGIARIDATLAVDLTKRRRDESVIRMSDAGKCARQIGYKLLGYRAESFSPQLLAIFAAGHVFEQLAVAGMRMAGLPVFAAQHESRSDDPPQLGHHDGRTVIDGVASLLEVKSANADRFAAMVSKGVGVSDPDYLVQMQTYMHHEHLPQAFYVAVNKNTSDVYTELVPYDAAMAEAIVARLRHIWAVTRTGALPDPEFNKASRTCRSCQFAPLCPGKAGKGNQIIVG
jgi:hypothetical protein